MNVVKSLRHTKMKTFFKNLPNQERKKMANLIRKRNVEIVINDTDKNIRACNADKEDVIINKECERQVSEYYVQYKMAKAQ